MNSSETLLSQELFDETVLENEECFDLSPEEALLETIDQFRQQLSAADGDNDDNCGGGARPPTPVAASSSSRGAAEESSGQVAEPWRGDAVVVPYVLSHLALSHPDSPGGRRDRESRRRFQNSLASLDACVNADGTVDVSGDTSEVERERFLGTLEGIGRRCRCGCESGGDNDNDATNAISGTSPLPYLAIFQRTSSIYTLMSFLSIIDPKDSMHCINTQKIQITNATALTLSSILVNNPARDDSKCVKVRSELRDSFVPMLGRLVCLIARLVKAIMTSSHHDDNDSLSKLLCDVLRLGTDATRACEGAKVAFVQSTLPPELDLMPHHNVSATKRGGVAVLVACLSIRDNDNAPVIHTRLLTEACRLITSLSRYDDFRHPSSSDAAIGVAEVSTSSAHDHAMEFHRAGAASALIRIARGVLTALPDGWSNMSADQRGNFNEGVEVVGTSSLASERLAAAALTALRVLAINDGIIQTMIALGILQIVAMAMGLVVSRSEFKNIEGEHRTVESQRFVASLLGLLRNLCCNDEIKTNLCLGSPTSSSGPLSSKPSILPCMLLAMRSFSRVAIVQEHACGVIAAMALRRPANARAVLDAGGPRSVLSAMKRHPENVSVQRQGSLAVRNVVSRLLRDLPEDGAHPAGSAAGAASRAGCEDHDERHSIRDVFLELGAEDVLRNIAGRHQGSVDEAYAALRDLGCTVSLVKFNADDLQSQQGRMGSASVGRARMFGEKHNSNFRPVYEESVGLADGVKSAISQVDA